MRIMAALRHHIVSLLGRLAAGTRYNELETIERDGAWYYRKRRRRFTGPLIVAGNRWLTWQSAGVQILSIPQWAQREEKLFAAVYGLRALIERDAIWLPVLPGEQLHQWLAAPERASSEKLQAVRSAITALAELHQTAIVGPAVRSDFASHGDATVANVLFDPKTGRSFWCDFEMQHDDDRPVDWRRADDLRAMLCSAAVVSGDAGLPALVEGVIASYPHADVIHNLQIALNHEVSRPCSYHMAQANLEVGRLVRLRDLAATNR